MPFEAGVWPLAGAVALLLSGAALLIWTARPRRKRSDLRAGQGCLVARTWWGRDVTRAIGSGTVAVGETVFAVAGRSLTGVFAICVVLAAGNVMAAISSAWSAISPGAVRVCAEGVEIRRGGRRPSLASWSELETNPNALYDHGLRGIQTHGIVAPSGGGRIPLRSLDVDPDRVIQVIIFYRDHPAERAAIVQAGTGRPLRHLTAPTASA